MNLIKTWKEFEDYILTFRPHEDIKVHKEFFAEGALDSFKSMFADDDGQFADYRIPIENDGKSIHVKEYEDYYKIHWDKANLATDPLGHLLKDAPHHIPAVTLGTLFALAVGYYIAKK